MTAHLNLIGEKLASSHTSRGHECGKVEPRKGERLTAPTVSLSIEESTAPTVQTS